MDEKIRSIGFLAITGAVTLALWAYGINSLINLTGLSVINPSLQLTEISLIVAGMFLAFFLTAVFAFAMKKTDKPKS